jgi:hypothetical protein
LTARATDGRTPLDIASQSGFEDLAHILEHAADGATQGKDVRTTTPVPAAEGHVERERTLPQPEAGATAQAEDGQTSIRVVAGEVHVVPAYHSPGHESYTTAEADNGWTPSDVAVAEGCVELARQSPEYGADAVPGRQRAASV